MRKSQVVPSNVQNERPTCERCLARMWLARIEPEKPDYDRRTFECPECEHSMTEVVKYRQA